MKKLFSGKHAKSFVSKAATLIIIGLIIATTFIAVSTSFANSGRIQRFCQRQSQSGSLPDGLDEPTCEAMLRDSAFSSALKTFLEQPSGSTQQPPRTLSGSIPPALTKNPQCPVYTDALTITSGTSWTLKVDGDPTCDFVNWTFPSNIASKNCTFTADGNFTDGIEIDFYSFTSQNHTFDTNQTDNTDVEGGTFSITNSNIIQAFLKPSTVQIGSTNLGNIKYSCN